jgi:hypothetical protein
MIFGIIEYRKNFSKTGSRIANVLRFIELENYDPG